MEYLKLRSVKEEYLKLRSVEVAIDTEGAIYEMKRKNNDWEILDAVEYWLDDVVVDWYDSLDNYDLMRLAMWCLKYNINPSYNFR